MGCEEKHKPRERLPALLALLPSLLLPLGIYSMGGKGEATLDLGRSREDTMQEQRRGREEVAHRGRTIESQKTGTISLFWRNHMSYPLLAGRQEVVLHPASREE
jgi:hypothetical protein